MFDKLSNALKTLMETITGIQSVVDYEASNLEGFPALSITPSGNEGDYSTTRDNTRVYAFMLRLYVARGSGAGEATAENTMRELVDSVLDKIDRNYYAFGSTVDAVSGYTFNRMEAAPSQWGYVGAANEMRVAEVVVRIHYEIDTSVVGA